MAFVSAFLGLSCILVLFFNKFTLPSHKIIYSYKNNINGFATLLSPDEVTKLSGMKKFQLGSCHSCSLSLAYLLILNGLFPIDLDEVVYVFPNQAKKWSL
uniref:Inhibitor I9 domain-containing protein n=1 Tax=Nelumbo nucifera TaxID=4432 RepID=A0A822YU36_NELNU|nr:TPA_asm: hypothetical protein HUJ06_006660 [Nelumbo nucifera]